MEVKIIIVFLVVLILNLIANDPVSAVFDGNRPEPKAEDVGNENSQYKCLPGRTVIKIKERPMMLDVDASDGSDEYMRSKPSARSHMRHPQKEETCLVCVCSVDGQNEYCSGRSAATVNECIAYKNVADIINATSYDHDRALENRIRRDYLWHNDEIPYSPRAKCFRGHSFYSNNPTANNTDVDVASDVDSLLNYASTDTCFYCVCSVDGNSIGCIHRDVSFCNFYRVIRSEKHIRDRYTSLLGQDRPTYFRELSFRLRRTMDNGIYDIINAVNQDGSTTKKCVPFISEYSNCNDDNLCSGCSRCTCTSEGQWSCRDVQECPDTPQDDFNIDGDDDEDAIFDNALNLLQFEMEKKRNIKTSSSRLVPSPQPLDDKDQLLAPYHDKTVDDFIESLSRPKRSVNMAKGHKKRSVDKEIDKHEQSGSTSHNDSIHFYNTVDEINEDTLKDSNLTGTVVANKVDMAPLLTRRSGSFVGNSSKALQIEYNQPQTYHPITDNKIEAEQESKFDASHENLKTVLGNYSQETKNKDVSKIVVNELKKGSEIIGDATAPVMSNITFTPENDTLIAMTFIAGNLLNKLWNMEKEPFASSMETDKLKQEKIADLLDLFKEPLNIRQETFLKNALEQLSSAIDKQREFKNISICETFQNIDKSSAGNDDDEPKKVAVSVPCNRKDKNKKEIREKKKKATVKAISKIHNVLDLIRRFERVQGNLSELKHGPKLNFDGTGKENKKYPETTLTNDETYSLNTFGNILEKITKLILPKRNNKKIKNVITSQNILLENDDLKKKFKKMYNIDLTNMTVTAKDKIVLDYLTHVERNPDCLLNSNNDDLENIPTLEGNILLNLSQFFKLKTFADLLKLLEPERTTPNPNISTDRAVVETTTLFENKKLSSNLKNGNLNKLNSTKERLKAHLKTIIEDLMQLQGTKGLSIKGQTKIADALPCIYNILKSSKDKDTPKKEDIEDPVKKVANIFNELKKEMKVQQTRRSSGNLVTERPKSAVVWDRLVKNLNNKTNSNTRRMFNSKIPKSYKQIKKSMERIENGSSTYKHYALLVKVPPSDKLILLKALEQEVQDTINVLADISLSLQDLIKLPKEQFTDLEEFISNMDMGIKLSEKVNNKIKSDEKAKETKFFSNEINSQILNTIQNKLKPVFRNVNARSEEDDQLRVSRAQIIAQLIRNRVNQFLNEREHQKGATDDIDYIIARRTIYYLDIGDYKLANDLYKMLFNQTEDKLIQFSPDQFVNEKLIVSSTQKYSDIPLRRMAQSRREMSPNTMLVDSSNIMAKYKNWMNQDQLIKQLLNIKSMRM